jgi:hypothetical protein
VSQNSRLVECPIFYHTRAAQTPPVCRCQGTPLYSNPTCSCSHSHSHSRVTIRQAPATSPVYSRPAPGDLSVVVPPVPIPNTAVKRHSANGSRTQGPARVGRRQIIPPPSQKRKAAPAGRLFLCPEGSGSGEALGAGGSLSRDGMEESVFYNLLHLRAHPWYWW